MRAAAAASAGLLTAAVGAEVDRAAILADTTRAWVTIPLDKLQEQRRPANDERRGQPQTNKCADVKCPPDTSTHNDCALGICNSWTGTCRYTALTGIPCYATGINGRCTQAGLCLAGGAALSTSQTSPSTPPPATLPPPPLSKVCFGPNPCPLTGSTVATMYKYPYAHPQCVNNYCNPYTGSCTYSLHAQGYKCALGMSRGVHYGICGATGLCTIDTPSVYSPLSPSGPIPSGGEDRCSMAKYNCPESKIPYGTYGSAHPNCIKTGVAGCDPATGNCIWGRRPAGYLCGKLYGGQHHGSCTSSGYCDIQNVPPSTASYYPQPTRYPLYRPNAWYPTSYPTYVGQGQASSGGSSNPCKNNRCTTTGPCTKSSICSSYTGVCEPTLMPELTVCRISKHVSSGSITYGKCDPYGQCLLNYPAPVAVAPVASRPVTRPPTPPQQPNINRCHENRYLICERIEPGKHLDCDGCDPRTGGCSWSSRTGQRCGFGVGVCNSLGECDTKGAIWWTKLVAPKSEVGAGHVPKPVPNVPLTRVCPCQSPFGPQHTYCTGAKLCRAELPEWCRESASWGCWTTHQFSAACTGTAFYQRWFAPLAPPPQPACAAWAAPRPGAAGARRLMCLPPLSMQECRAACDGVAGCRSIDLSKDECCLNGCRDGEGCTVDAARWPEHQYSQLDEACDRAREKEAAHAVGGECRDVAGWHSAATQAGYPANQTCADFGDYLCRSANSRILGTSGLTARGACCACGGGVRADAAEPAAACADVDQWHDSAGDHGWGRDFTCQDFNSYYCERYGASYPAADGSTAREACCACGGGRRSAGAAPAPGVWYPVVLPGLSLDADQQRRRVAEERGAGGMCGWMRPRDDRLRDGDAAARGWRLPCSSPCETSKEDGQMRCYTTEGRDGTDSPWGYCAPCDGTKMQAAALPAASPAGGVAPAWALPVGAAVGVAALAAAAAAASRRRRAGLAVRPASPSVATVHSEPFLQSPPILFDTAAVPVAEAPAPPELYKSPPRGEFFFPDMSSSPAQAPQATSGKL